MIKKSLIFFIILFATYNIFLRCSKKEQTSFQSEYQLNLINAQRYLYLDTLPDGVMIGTSLSYRLPLDSLKGVYQLSMSGLSLTDGMAVLRQRSSFPHRVFIEINYFFKEPMPMFTNAINSAAINWAKGALPALKEENQPVNFLLDIVKQKSGKGKGKAGELEAAGTVTSALYEKLLKMQQERYSAPIDTLKFKKAVDRLAEYVNEITGKGSKVCLFEMPVDTSLEKLPMAVVTRAMVHDRLKTMQNVFFVPLSPDFYVTRDGVHLDKSAFPVYGRYLKHAVDSLISKGF